MFGDPQILLDYNLKHYDLKLSNVWIGKKTHEYEA